MGGQREDFLSNIQTSADSKQSEVHLLDLFNPEPDISL
jgi:hypothetical protein